MLPPTSFTSLRQRVPSQYLWPVLVLVGICFGCLVTVLAVTTSAQDDRELAREQQSIERAVQTAAEMAIRDLQDYAKWDDAVRHMAQGIDSDWMADNVVAYLADEQGYSHVLALNAKDQIAFARVPGGLTAAAKFVDSHEFRRAIQKLRAMPVNGNPY